MNCTQCGKPLHPRRSQCDFCGADAPLSQPDVLHDLTERVRRVGASVVAFVRHIRRPHAGGRLSLRTAVPLGLLVLVVAALFAIPALTREDAPSETSTGAAPTSVNGQDARTTDLQAALDAAEERLRDLEATQARTQAAAEASAATAEGEIARLQEQVKVAEAAAKAAQEATDRATRRIQALTECLNGTTVALQFGRTDAWDPADRALAAVSAACADARSLR